MSPQQMEKPHLLCFLPQCHCHENVHDRKTHLKKEQALCINFLQSDWFIDQSEHF